MHGSKRDLDKTSPLCTILSPLQHIQLGHLMSNWTENYHTHTQTHKNMEFEGIPKEVLYKFLGDELLPVVLDKDTPTNTAVMSPIYLSNKDIDELLF